MLQVTAAIIEKNGEILITQRASDDECAMLWEFPGGKLEKGETLEDCIIREIKEELNLDIALNGIFSTSVYHYNEKEIHFTVFNAKIVSGEVRLNVHNDARWVRIQELGEFEFMPPDVGFVNKLREISR